MADTFFKYHFEWIVLLTGLVLLAAMNPYVDNGISLCLLDAAGFPFCPGEGLGHSIALTFRFEFENALAAHPFGPAAVGILSFRIGHLLKRAYRQKNSFHNNRQ